MGFYKWFLVVSLVSIHGLVAYVFYDQRARTDFLNKKINAVYRTHRQGGQSNRGSKVLKCYKKLPSLKQGLPGRGACPNTPKDKTRVNL